MNFQNLQSNTPGAGRGIVPGNTVQTTLNFSKGPNTSGGGLSGNTGFQTGQQGTTGTNLNTGLSGNTGMFQPTGQGMQVMGQTMNTSNTTSFNPMGGQTNLQTSTGLGQQTTGGTTGFGLNPTQSGMFFPNTNIGFNKPNTGMSTFQPNTGFQQNVQNVQNVIPNKSEIDKGEIYNVIQNFINCSNAASPCNFFKFFVYNKSINTPDYLPYLQSYQPNLKDEKQNDILIDYNLWLKATEKNPDPSRYYPTQISSVDELRNRIHLNNLLLSNTFGDINQAHNQAANVYEQQTEVVENKLRVTQNKLQEIKNKQFKLMCKIEIVAQNTKKASFNYDNLNLLNNKISNLRNKANDNMEKVGKLIKLSEVTIENEGELLKDFSKERLDRCLNALVDMKNVIESNFSFLDKTQETMNFIRHDLDNIKRYGKP
jgi:hypothetical protein